MRMRLIIKLLVLATGLWCSSAYNIETGKTHSLFLRNGGTGNYGNYEEAAYAGYTFDVTLDGDVASILVGQPRSGEINRTESPGALYHCSFKFMSELDSPSTTELPPTTQFNAPTLNTGIDLTDFTTNANDATTKKENITKDFTTTPGDFRSLECTKLNIFDWKNLTHRDFDHKNHADALGLSIARLKNTTEYAVCVPLRQRVCPNDASYAPGACYVGNPKQNKYWTFKQWNETGCFTSVIEIMFVVDGSESIGDTNFALVKEWLINVTTLLSESYGETVRTQVLQYSNKDKRRNKVHVQDSKMFEIPYTLNDALSIEQISERIRNMKYLNSTTYTNFALTRAMITEFPRSKNSNTSKKIVVVLTDGKANDGAALSCWYSDHGDKVTSFAVGVGNDTSLSELRTIANGNKKNEDKKKRDKRVLRVGEFDQLQSVIKTLIGKITSIASVEGTVTAETTAEDIGSIQIGTSIASSRNGGLYFGAVGAYEEAGTIVKYDDVYDPTADMTTYPQIQDAFSSRTSDSYFGYSSVVGYFEGPSSDYYIASGAPRHLLVGVVVVYNPVENSNVLDNHKTIILSSHKRQVAEYFGGSLLALDVSGDGKDDLFVGAPLYIGDKYDEGRVFVYISQKADTVQTWATSYEPLELYGNQMPAGRFGTAIANAGDVNLDGFNDVVIGAPLAEEARGAVYIYHGKDGGLEISYTQKILASSITGETPMYFGQFIQGKVDIDDNKYPDIFVGAPRSDSVVILRSRPIAKISATIEFTTLNIDLLECIKKQYTNCTSLKICFVANGTSIESIIGIRYSVKLDTKKTGYDQKRVSYSHIHDSNMEINIDKDKMNCFIHEINMMKGIDDFETSISAELEFGMHPSHLEKPLSSVMELAHATNESAYINFAKDCVTSICLHDIKIAVNLIQPTFNTSSQNESTNEFSHGNMLVIDSSTVTFPAILQVNISNSGEKAFRTAINVTYPSLISLSELGRRLSNSASTACVVEYGEPICYGDGLKTQTYRFNSYENIMLSETWCYFELNLITENLKNYGTLESISVNVTAYTSSDSSHEILPADNTREIFTNVIYRSDFTLRKESSNVEISFNATTNDTTISSVEEIGGSTPDVKMDFRVSGVGYNNIPLSDVTLSWPWKTNAGDILLYLYKLDCYAVGSGADNSTACNCDHTNVNPFNLTIGDYQGNASNRVTVSPATTPLDVSEIDCTSDDTGKALCEYLKCNITNLAASDQVYLTASFRLWTSSINFNGADQTQVLLKSKLEVSTINSPLIIDKNGNSKISKSEEVTTKAKKFTIGIIEGKFDYTIIILAAAGGVLILAFIVGILWKIGFFKRKYADMKKEAQHNTDKEEETEQTTDTILTN